MTKLQKHLGAYCFTFKVERGIITTSNEAPDGNTMDQLFLEIDSVRHAGKMEKEPTRVCSNSYPKCALRFLVGAPLMLFF